MPVRLCSREALLAKGIKLVERDFTSKAQTTSAMTAPGGRRWHSAARLNRAHFQINVFVDFVAVPALSVARLRDIIDLE